MQDNPFLGMAIFLAAIPRALESRRVLTTNPEDATLVFQQVPSERKLLVHVLGDFWYSHNGSSVLTSK
jgi:hypothetical protein